MKTHKNKDILIRFLYVSDIIIIGNNQELILEFKKKIIKEFGITDFGLLNYFFEIEVDQSSEGSFIYQNNCNLVTIPLQGNEKLCKNNGNEKAN